MSRKKLNLESLCVFNTTVFGFERHAFSSKWLRASRRHARVVINSEGSIVGYTVVRPTSGGEEGYRIGQLFADSEPILRRKKDGDWYIYP